MNKFAFRTTIALLWIAAFHLTIWPYITPARGQTVGGRFTVIDTIPPAPVIDLLLINPAENSLTLTWTAPGDDANQGTATQYDIRYSRSPIHTESDWDAATQLNNPPIPLPAGSSEILTITNLSSNIGYYFSLKTSDESLNWSDLSNCASVTYCVGWAEPRLIVDLDGQVTSWLIQPNGTLLEDVYATDKSGDIVIRIPTGSQILDALMNTQSSIRLTRTTTAPAPPDNYNVINAFDLGPEGSTANPGIEICIFYSDDILAQGTDETNLAIAIFDDSNVEWIFLNNMVDLDNNTITFSTSRLYMFAVMAPSTMIPGPTGKPSPVPQPSTPVIVTTTPTPNPSSIPEATFDTPDMRLDLNDTDLVSTEAGTEDKFHKTVWHWPTIMYICLINLLAITILAWPVIKKPLRRLTTNSSNSM